MTPRLRRAVIAVTLALTVTIASAGCGPDDAATPDEPDTAAPDDPSAPDDTNGPDDPEPPVSDTSEPSDEPDDTGDDPDEPAPPGPQTAAVWIHLFDDTLKDAESIHRSVDRAVDAGVDTLLVQVVRRHDAYYPSQVLPQTPDDQLAEDLDVVETVLAAADGRASVHAWIGVAPAWHGVYEELEEPDGWVWSEHGPDAPVDDRWVTRTADGVWTDYLDVGLDAVHAHVAAVARELVERYPLDGVHLDYVRYRDAASGYHPDAVAAWQAATGRDDVPEPDDASWSDWRRGRLEVLLDRVVDEVGEVDPDAEVSVAAVTWGQPPAGDGLAGTRGYDDALQDWAAWVRDGRVDVVYPMNYFRAFEPEAAAWFDGWIDYEAALQPAEAADGHARVVPGIGGWLNSGQDVVDQLTEACRVSGAVALYSFQQPADDDTPLGRLLAEPCGR